MLLGDYAWLGTKILLGVYVIFIIMFWIPLLICNPARFIELLKEELPYIYLHSIVLAAIWITTFMVG